MNNASKFAQDKLRAASRAKDLSRHWTLALGTAAAAFFILFLVAFLDYRFMLPMPVRLAGMAALALLIGTGIFRLARSLRRPTAPKEAALDAEAQSPALGCELSTAAEYLTGQRTASIEYEAELAAALQEKASANLRSLEIPYWKQPLRPALLLGLVSFALLLFGLLATGALTAFTRAAVPWTKITYTQVDVKPGNLEVPVGRDVEIKSVFTGRIPTQAQFAWQDEGSPKWQVASLTRNEKGEYVYPLKSLKTGLKYRVSGSDAVSPDFTVQTYVPPEVKDWRVSLDYPAYTKRAKTEQTSPEIAVLRGSTASFKINPSTKLAKASLRFKDQPPIELQPSENGSWKGDLKISKDTEYWIELADAKGHKGGNETPFQIKALPDAPPKVEITEPGQDMRAEATNTIPVKISVTDDFGVDEIRLVYHRLGGSEQVVTAKRNGETNTEFSAEIPLAPLELKEYELVAYHAEASDNNTLDGPGIGKSDVFFIEITNEEGAAGKKQPPKKGQKVNLLVIQKQIIGDTTALAANAPKAQFADLAKRQQDAAEFGKMYLSGMASAGVPAAVSQEMEAAVRDMETAQASLEKNERNGSLASEESALARLYNILKIMPELKDLPTAPKMAKNERMKQEDAQEKESPVVKVVLEAIKKKKKEQPDNKEAAEALEAAKKLEEEQSALILGMQNTGEAQGEAEVKQDRSGKNSKPASGKKEGKDGKSGKPKEEQQAAAKEGEKGEKGEKGEEGKEGKDGKGSGKPGDKPGDPKEAQKMAEKESELSKEAAALAEKLARMAGKDARLGHGAGKKMSEAAAKMGEAAEAMSKGEGQKGGTKGGEGAASLQSAIALLERIVNDRADRADVSKEDFPKEYEAVISDYLKKLSYEQ